MYGWKITSPNPALAIGTQLNFVPAFGANAPDWDALLPGERLDVEFSNGTRSTGGVVTAAIDTAVIEVAQARWIIAPATKQDNPVDPGFRTSIWFVRSRG